jgi:hypothetical protein
VPYVVLQATSDEDEYYNQKRIMLAITLLRRAVEEPLVQARGWRGMARGRRVNALPGILFRHPSADFRGFLWRAGS